MRLASFGAALLVLSGCGGETLSHVSGTEAAGDFDWRSVIAFTAVPDTGFSGETFRSAYYKDVMSHARQKFTVYSAMTNAHETNHQLNSDMRNSTAANDNTIYFEAGKAAMVLEPTTPGRRIRDFVPDYIKTKSSRYQHYLVEQVDNYWPQLLYQFDEWGSYRAGTRVAVELDKAGTLDQGRQGEVCIGDGAVEFLYFATAAVAALSHDEAAYLRDNRQFKAAFAMLAEQTTDYYNYGKGRHVFDCDGSDFLDHFKTSPDNAANRAALKAWIGGAWTERVLGF